VDGPIESAKTVERLKDQGIPREASVDQGQISEAVAFLALQGGRAMTYELAVTASGRPPMIF
jgi:hypothetical protein